jgi:hypothetical protein
VVVSSCLINSTSSKSLFAQVGTSTERALKTLILGAAPLLRAQASDPTASRGALILTRTGARAAAVGGIVSRTFARMGLPGLTSRSARVSCIAAFREARVSEEAEKGAAKMMARISFPQNRLPSYCFAFL